MTDDLSRLWVDTDVLSCCNKAYDLALVHGAEEVGPEHFIHAITLVPGAVKVLIAYNINAITLRQESASMMASTQPLTSTTAGQISPSNSEEFLGILHHAADLAYAQRSPITMNHILDVLFDMKSERISHNFKRHHRPDWSLHGKSSVSFEDTREGEQNGPSVTDDIQNTRLDELERLVHTLSDEISDNKDTLQEILLNLKSANGTQDSAGTGIRTNGHHREETKPRYYSDETIEHLYAIQSNIEEKFAKLARGWNALGQRIDNLEDAVAAGPQTEVKFDESTLDSVIKNMDRTLGDNFAARIERQISELLDRKLSAELNNSTQSLHNILTKAIETRFANILDARLQALTDATDALISRSELGDLKANIDGFDAKLRHIETNLSGLPTRLASMQQTMEQGTTSIDLAPLTQKISIATQEIRADLEMLEKRVGAIPHVVDKMETRVDDTNLLVQGFGDRFDELHRTLADSGLTSEQVQIAVDEATNRTAEIFQTQTADLTQSVTQATASQLSAESEKAEMRAADQNRMLTAILETITRIESQNDEMPDTAPLKTSIDEISRENDATRNALVKINTNQQTLAAAFDHWGKETRDELSGLHKELKQARLSEEEKMPDLTSKLNTLHKKFEELQTSLAQPQSIRTRLSIWLYGTDDWFEASWGLPPDNMRTRAKA